MGVASHLLSRWYNQFLAGFCWGVIKSPSLVVFVKINFYPTPKDWQPKSELLDDGDLIARSPYIIFNKLQNHHIICVIHGDLFIVNVICL